MGCLEWMKRRLMSVPEYRDILKECRVFSISQTSQLSVGTDARIAREH